MPKAEIYLLCLMNSIAGHKQPTALAVLFQTSRNKIVESVTINDVQKLQSVTCYTCHSHP